MADQLVQFAAPACKWLVRVLALCVLPHVPTPALKRELRGREPRALAPSRVRHWQERRGLSSVEVRR